MEKQTTIDSQLNKKLTNGIGIVLAAITITVFIAAAASAFTGPSNTLQDMETVYQRLLSEKEQTQKLLTEQTETVCLQEISIAKKKAEEHYAGTTPLDTEVLERILAKAEGKNLDCRGF